MKYLLLLFLLASCEPEVKDKEDGTPYQVNKICDYGHNQYMGTTIVSKVSIPQFIWVCDHYHYDTTYVNREDQPIQ